MNLSIEDAQREQDDIMTVYAALDKYSPKKSEYETAKNNLLINAKKFMMEGKLSLMRLKAKYFYFFLMKE